MSKIVFPYLLDTGVDPETLRGLKSIREQRVNHHPDSTQGCICTRTEREHLNAWG